MHHHVYSQSDKYPIAILVKGNAFNLSEIRNYYIDELEKQGLSRDDMIIVALPYNSNNKAPAGFIKTQLAEILPELESLGVQTLYCADAPYFKVLTRQTKAVVHLGYVLSCKIKDFETLDVILGINQKVIMYDPKNQSKLKQSLKALASHRGGHYIDPGANITQNAQFLLTREEIETGLEELHKHSMLTADIEGASLRFEQAGIGTITFCWSQDEGIVFPVDYRPLRSSELAASFPVKGKMVVNPEIRALLKDFLTRYNGCIIWHNVNYDLKVLICELWMEDLSDTAGLLKGLSVLTQNFHDTRIIAYLATNSTAGNELGLKTIAHEFAGNWAKDVKDITKLDLMELLEYNFIDGASTWYVYNKHYPTMVADNQLDLYNDLMLPSLKTLIQTELTGMPLNPVRVQQVKAELQSELQVCTDVLEHSGHIKTLNKRLQQEAMEAANTKLKIKQHPLSKFSDVVFNPNSPIQISKLLYEQLELPVLDLTPTKQPATGTKTLEKLTHHTQDLSILPILNALIRYSEIEKILSSFIPAFEKAINKGDSVVWLHGSFNLGGTVSGRLSSSDPNLQNLPAGNTGSEFRQSLGKKIKSCFQAPDGWLFAGADFNSLEDYVSALQTRDPNKLKVYEQGFDGHCLRAFYYFADQLPGIVETPESINSIKKDYPLLRQDSKAPTFLLTYGGTFRGMMKNLGWPEDKAKEIEKAYHDLYQVSDQWVQARLDEAADRGYVECAFGLRVRTPILHKTLRNSKMNPYEAQAEARTAGNALGQSYGLLTNRAFNQFMQEVWSSPYWDSILPIGLIHDAIYLVIRDNIHVVHWVNQHLIKAMQWQELPELKHDTVKLGAELSIFWPNWASELSLPNNIDQDELRILCGNFIKDKS